MNREELFGLLWEALTRWNIDQELGDPDALRRWINDYLDEIE